MKRGWKSTRHSGLVNVTFNVSKDAASHIRQSVVSSWQRMQELGVVSLQLDQERLISDNTVPVTELTISRNTELQQCELTQLSRPLSGFTEFNPLLNSHNGYRSTRGGKRSRNSSSQVTRRKREDAFSQNLCCNTVSAASVTQAEIFTIGDNTSQRFSLNLTSREHVLPTSDQRMPSSQLPCHTPDFTFGSTALSTESSAAYAKYPFTANMLQLKLVEQGNATATFTNTVQSHLLPPPSTPFVPKRRKRRKPADVTPEAVPAKLQSYSMVNYSDHATLPQHVNGSIEDASKLFWENCTNKRFPLNGHYPQRFSSPTVSTQYMVGNAHLVPSGYANPRSPVAMANYAKLPAEQQTVLGSGRMEFLPTTTSELRSICMQSVRRNLLPVGSSSLPGPLLGSSVPYPVQGQHGQLQQSTICSPKLSNHFSQGTLELRHCNPETYGVCAVTAARSNVVDSAEHFCRNVNSQSSSVSLAISTEKNRSSQINSCDSLSPETQSSVSSEGSNMEKLIPFLKSSEKLSSNSVVAVDTDQCSSALSSVCCSSRSVNSNITSETTDCNLPRSSSAVAKKCKSDVVNGYHFPPDFAHVEAWNMRHMPVSSSSNCVDRKGNFHPAVDCSSFTRPVSHEKAPTETNSLQSANATGHCDHVQHVNSIENSHITQATETSTAATSEVSKNQLCTKDAVVSSAVSL